MMGALRLMPALGPGQGDGLGAKQLVQRRQPVRMDPGEQVVARGRHPRQHRADEIAQFHARPLLLLRSLVSRCSLDHGGSFGPRHAGPLSWPTRFSRRPGSRRYLVLKFNRARDIPVVVVNSYTDQTFIDKNGRMSTMMQRNSQTWVKTAGRWLLVDQHNSGMPGAPYTP